MKLYDAGTVTIVVVLVATVLFGLVSQFFYGNDNAFEQAAEQVIEKETGMKIDLSPEKMDVLDEK